MPSVPTTIDDYIDGFPEPTQVALHDVRRTIAEAAPDALETFSYGIPTFDLRGKHLVHFAGFRAHVGFYPTPSGIEAFRDELAPYPSGKGSVRFPLDEPIPLDLIRRITAYRVREVVSG
jgi:uncharacterized protein YdhG (YjbR/CyaY superfamily)